MYQKQLESFYFCFKIDFEFYLISGLFAKQQLTKKVFFVFVLIKQQTLLTAFLITISYCNKYIIDCIFCQTCSIFNIHYFDTFIQISLIFLIAHIFYRKNCPQLVKVKILKLPTLLLILAFILLNLLRIIIIFIGICQC